MVGHFWKPYTEQAVGDKWDVLNLIGGAEDQAAIQLVMNTQLRKRGDEKFYKDMCRGGK
jgi:hypothetical protein